MNIIRNFWLKKKPQFGHYSIVYPRKVSLQKTVPNNIIKPSYAKSGDPGLSVDYPEIKNDKQIQGMKESCQLAASILKRAGNYLKVGLTTDEIDNFVHKLIVEHNAYPSPLNYRLFPKSICTSVNNVACHGIPDDRPLEDGDIINIDITVFYNNYHGDCSKTFLIGNVDDEGQNLVKATETCLNEAIKLCKPDQCFSYIGEFIEDRAQLLGYNVVPAFIGHGIGSYFHGPPDIFHIRNNYPGKMQSGMTFTIEPVLTQGSKEIVILEDNWTAVTIDYARTAQFEHTILINDNGCEILTQ